MPVNQVENLSLVIFGASGDLTHRKLIPALFNLFLKRRLPERFHIVGFSRRPWDDEAFRKTLRKGLAEFMDGDVSEREWGAFQTHLLHIRGEFGDASGYQALSERLSEIEDGPCGRLFYLATPPRFFAQIVDDLAAASLTEETNSFRRVVIEKPFGHDLDSARMLNASVHKNLREDQVYRIDHYLGKETVQNVLIFRFANAIFEPLWNRNYIDNVQITVSETVGVGHRAGYYDHVGVLRDMFQNHLLQLLTLVAMEPPSSFTADALRNEKTKVLQAIRPITGDEIPLATVRGQYRGYREEEGVDPASNTATFAAVRLDIDNWRWQGVPFYLRSGKNLAEKATEILIDFKCPPHMMFPLPPEHHLRSNILALCIQPDEGIHLRFEAKVPDTAAEMRSVDMDFHYAESFGSSAIPEAYERLLLDAINGDASLFTRSDEIELAWQLIDPIIEAWGSDPSIPLAFYEPASHGPSEAEAFLEREGRSWKRGCGMHAA